ncbi:MAG: C39 family peptidase, partial [Oscillospiraceae bacterium]|nr:C39 family peptidase [Oscillospiraceae bacterium]
MSGGTISIIECKGGIYKTVVREKGKSGYRSPTLDVFVEGAVTGQNAYIPTEMIMQNPELPTGCEITSLTMLLRHIGYDADKLDMADNYLPKGEYRASDFKEV